MQTIDRRDCMKHMCTGLAALSAGGLSLPVFGKQTEGKSSATSSMTANDFWKRVDQVKASTLTHSAINAARAGVQAQREVNASKRAAILLGGEAGKDQMARAEKQYQTRTAELKKTKQVLAEFIRSTGDSGETKFRQFLGKDGLKEALEHARKSTIQLLLRSDISSQEAETARKTLDERIARIQAMTSFHDLTGYLDQHLDELIAQKMSQEDPPNSLCVFLLLITSLYVVLLLVSIVLCVLLLGLVPCDQIFCQILVATCGGTCP